MNNDLSYSLRLARKDIRYKQALHEDQVSKTLLRQANNTSNAVDQPGTCLSNFKSVQGLVITSNYIATFNVR